MPRTARMHTSISSKMVFRTIATILVFFFFRFRVAITSSGINNYYKNIVSLFTIVFQCKTRKKRLKLNDHFSFPVSFSSFFGILPYSFASL